MLASTYWQSTNRTARGRHARLVIEELERRLPPGDALLSLLLASMVGSQTPGLANPPELAPAPDRDVTDWSTLVEPDWSGDQLEVSAVIQTSSEPTKVAQPFDNALRSFPELAPPFSTSAAAPLRGLGGSGLATAGASASGSSPAGGSSARDAVLSALAAPAGTPGAVAAPTIGLGAQGGTGRSHTAPAAVPTSQPTAAPLGQAPLSFEANQGQTDGRVRFLAHGSGYTAFFAASETVFTLTPAIASVGVGDMSPAGSAAPAVVRMQLVGGSSATQVVGLDPLPGKVNYFLGNDPAQWHTHVPTFARVEYQQVYPGVDLAYYGAGQQLEYDFLVAPGADPGTIRVHFAGADQLGLDAQGNLVITAGGMQLVQQHPTVYQDMGGVRAAVSSGFVLDGQDVGFHVGAHDPGRPLVIDPVLSYSTFFGGDGLTWGDAVAVDQSGNVYVGGRVTNSTNFPAQNAFQPNPGGADDGFVMELSADGSTVLYATYLGGRFADQVTGIAVDEDGSAYVAGFTASPDFPTANALQPTNGGGFAGDAFVTKFNADGSELEYSTYLGGSGNDVAYGIAVDPNGNAYITGATQSHDFPTANAIQPNLIGITDAFVTAIAAGGQSLIYSTYLGGTGETDQVILGEHGHFAGIAVDANGDAFVTGKTNCDDFPITPSAVQPTRAGGFDTFVTALTSDGSAFIYSTYLGGSGDDHALGIAVDGDGNAYVVGQTNSRDFPTANALQPQSGGGIVSGYLSKLSPDGSALVYSTYFGGSGFEIIDGVALDPADNVVLVGETGSRDLPLANPIQASYGGGFSDAFVAKVDASGASLIYSTYLGGSGEDRGWGVAVDQEGSVYVTGKTASTDFPTVNAWQATYGGGIYNAFITKISDT